MQDDGLDEVIRIRLSVAERAVLVAMAEAAGDSLTNVIRKGVGLPATPFAKYGRRKEQAQAAK